MEDGSLLVQDTEAKRMQNDIVGLEEDTESSGKHREEVILAVSWITYEICI